MPPQPRLHKPNATIILKKSVNNSKNASEISKKKIHSFVELVKTNPLMYTIKDLG